MTKLLEIHDLDVFFNDGSRNLKILDGVNFSVAPSEIVALIGESGSGKTVLARSIMRLLDPVKFKVCGSIFFEGKDMAQLPEKHMAGIRGKNIGMVFQEPLSFLDPTMPMGRQLSEPLLKHCGAGKRDTFEKMVGLLEALNIPDAYRYMRLYPHQLSGGMAQKGMLAMAASCSPGLMIADEPTSSLDSVAQTLLVTHIKDLNVKFGISVVFITHDLKLASSIAHRVAIMSRGSIVEEGTVKDIFQNPQHEATKRLLKPVAGPVSQGSSRCSEKNAGEGSLPDTNVKSSIKLIDISKIYEGNKNDGIKALDGISLDIYSGETLGILGESGCGKSTLARIITRIIRPTGGSILYNDTDIYKTKDYPKKVQMIFQDPLSSLDPGMRVLDIVAEGLDIHGICRSKGERHALVEEYLIKAGLDEGFLYRYPHQLSGGQRQRVSIARALIMKPRLLVCDEPTSCLDTVSQAHILELLQKLKNEENLTMLFISHNLHVLGNISDRIAVMKDGRIVELGHTAQVMGNPRHPYTQMLLEMY